MESDIWYPWVGHQTAGVDPEPTLPINWVRAENLGKLPWRNATNAPRAAIAGEVAVL